MNLSSIASKLSNRVSVVGAFLRARKGICIRRRKTVSEDLRLLIRYLDKMKRTPSDESFRGFISLVTGAFERWSTEENLTTQGWVNSWVQEARSAPKSQRKSLIELACVLGEPETAKRFLKPFEKSAILSMALDDPRLVPGGWGLVPIRRLWTEKGQSFLRESYAPMRVYEMGQLRMKNYREGVFAFRCEPETVGPSLLTAFGLIKTSGGGLVLSDPGADPSLGFVSGLWPFLEGSAHNTSRVLLSDRAFQGRPSVYLQTAVDMTGRNSSNYWHAMVEYLPRLKNIGHDTSIPVVASAELQPATRKALEVLIGPDRAVHYLTSNQHAHVEELTVLGFNTRVIDNLVAPLDSGGAHDVEPLQWLAQSLLRKLERSPAGPEKIFIERTGARRHATNWAEVRAKLVREGFTGVDLASLSLEDQISLFYHASCIVGIGGAHWANLLFCQEGTKVLSIAPSIMVDWPLHDELAKDFGLEFASLSCRQGESLDSVGDLARFLHGDFFVEVDELEQAMQDLFTKSVW